MGAGAAQLLAEPWWWVRLRCYPHEVGSELGQLDVVVGTSMQVSLILSLPPQIPQAGILEVAGLGSEQISTVRVCSAGKNAEMKMVINHGGGILVEE